MPARNSGAKAGRCVARQRQKQHHCRWGPTVQTRLSMAPIKQYLEHASFCKNIQGWQANKTVWPSGLRRWLKAPFRKGVGSNPTAVICAARSCVQCAECGGMPASWLLRAGFFLCWYSVSSLGSILRPEANSYWLISNNSATGTRTRVARVRAEYPNQLDYSGAECNLTQILSRRICSTSYHFRRVLRDGWGHVRKRRRDAPEKTGGRGRALLFAPQGPLL